MKVKNERVQAKKFNKSTIRLLIKDWDYYLREGTNVGINHGMEVAVHTLQYLESEALGTLQRYFTPEEWKYMAIIFRWSIPMEEQRMDKNLLAKFIRSSAACEDIAEKYGVDLAKLTDKVYALTSIQCLAVCNRIRDFFVANPEWRSDHSLSINRLNNWAEF